MTDLIKPGWWEQVAAPDILAADTLDELDEYKARIDYLADRIEEGMRAVAFEFEAALRVIDKRRGDLLGPPRPGQRTDLQPVTRELEVEVPAMTRTRWRKIADHWDDVVQPHLEATARRAVQEGRSPDRWEVTQRRCLELIETVTGDPERVASRRQLVGLIRVATTKVREAVRLAGNADASAADEADRLLGAVHDLRRALGPQSVEPSVAVPRGRGRP